MPEIEKTYEPGTVEPKWYASWLESRLFRANPASGKPAYSIVIPPPNVTGVLTLGHVLNNTIQDILARRARMLGKEVLWLPGTDHAGIATQTVVERTLKKQGAIRHRDDLGREKFVEKVLEWKEKHGGIIIEQLKRLGCSCDWSRERFTMDEAYSRCVQRVFVDLYAKGRIYRGKRMVNWCPASLTALSDEEVVMKAQRGSMTYFKVQVARQPGVSLTIATTRPETIPGDTAIAVNPRDERFRHLIGQKAIRPLPANLPEKDRLIPIVGDEQVDFAFGTGVLKVTPAHDKADFEIGQRHGLPAVDVMHPDGTMNALAGEALAGLDRFKARTKAVELLQELGAFVKEEPYENNVGYSERADVPIEPRLSEQWFLRYPSVEEARNCVAGSTASAAATAVPPSPAIASSANGASADSAKASARMHFFPERWEKVYGHWLAGLQDWCISRQLWWGHRVPVWSKAHGSTGAARAELSELLSSAPDPRGESAATALPETAAFVGEDAFLPTTQIPTEGPEDGTDRVMARIATVNADLAGKLEAAGWSHDPDVLDTWFSSWLWPFATMGWPDQTPELARFYPTTDLVTGPDIIFFWVARMIMAGFEYMGEIPFKNVYFTGIIRDKQGRKMSKSLGNSPDPLDLIARYGADALRFGVMRSAPLGADILFDEKNVELGRNFCTKLWNAARFRQMQGGETEGEIVPALLGSDDQWILQRLDETIAEVSAALDDYRFSDAAQGLYRFFWTNFCDWYVEASKAALGGDDPARKANCLAVIDFVFAHTLRLFHPFLPFITEELWHGLGYNQDLPDGQGGETIQLARWPQALGDDFRAHYQFTAEKSALAESKQAAVEAGRGLRRDFNIASNKRVRFVLRTDQPLAPDEAAVLRLLLNADSLEIADSHWIPPTGTPGSLTPLGELFLPLEGLIDATAERERLRKEMAKVEDDLAKVRAKLSSPAFTEKVPPAVLAEHHQRQVTAQERLAQLQRLLAALGQE